MHMTSFLWSYLLTEINQTYTEAMTWISDYVHTQI